MGWNTHQGILFVLGTDGWAHRLNKHWRVMGWMKTTCRGGVDIICCLSVGQAAFFLPALVSVGKKHGGHGWMKTARCIMGEILSLAIIVGGKGSGAGCLDFVA